MKVSSVCINRFRGQPFKGMNPSDNSNPFWYTYNDRKQKVNRFKEFVMPWLLVGAAVAAASAVVIKLMRGKGLPISAVEIKNQNIGLNKLKEYPKTAEAIKNQFIYPIIDTISGDKHFIKDGLLKKGLIIATENNIADAKTIYSAFCEHMHFMRPRLYTLKMPEDMGNIKKDRLKWVYEALERAKKRYKENGSRTLILFGDLEKLVDFTSKKGVRRNIEKKLAEINIEKYPGVYWACWTDKAKSLPLFYRKIPALITKAVD